MAQKQTSGDLLRHLENQVRFLLRSVDAFDRGEVSEAIRMAASIRVLVQDTANQVSLLKQLGMKDRLFLDSAGPFRPANLLPQNNLAAIRSGPDGAKWVPKGAGGTPRVKWRPFGQWWTRPVIRDSQQREFSRSKLVLTLADKDGGAHVDATMSDEYFDLTRQNSMGWVYVPTSGDVQQFGDPLPAAIRQVADEMLKTLRRYSIASFPEDRRDILPIRLPD